MTTKAELLESIGAVAESQTRRRISDEKTAPDGTLGALVGGLCQDPPR